MIHGFIKNTPVRARGYKLAGWNFDWNFSESCQFTKYKLNQYMTGTVILGTNLTINQMIQIHMVKLESYL
jgi:hypothetical protein